MSNRLAPDRTSYTAALAALASGGCWAEAARLLTAMAAAGFAPETAAYSLAIDAHARHGLSTAALRLLREMSREGIAPDLLAYSMVISAAGQRGEPSRTCVLWDELRAAHGAGSEQVLPCSAHSHTHDSYTPTRLRTHAPTLPRSYTPRLLRSHAPPLTKSGANKVRRS